LHKANRSDPPSPHRYAQAIRDKRILGIYGYRTFGARYSPVAILHFVICFREQEVNLAMRCSASLALWQDLHGLRVVALNVGAERCLERLAGVHAIRRGKSRDKKKRDNGVNESANSHWAAPENRKHRN